MKKKLFPKSLGDALGTFLDQQRYQKKLYRGGYDQKKIFSQNEKSQRWIDSQLNSAPFKTDFKLK